MRAQDSPIKSPSSIRLAYWESLLAVRSGAVQITIALFVLLMVTAMILGVVRAHARQSKAQIVEQENRLVKEICCNVLQGSLDSPGASGEISTRQSRLENQLRISAKSPYLVSHATDLWQISLLPSPLSALSVGASSNWPDSYPIHGVSLAMTVQRANRVRPSLNAYGPFDATFVLMAIAPLVVIGLTFNASSRDRESALQSLVLTQTQSLGKLMAIRCLVRAGLVILLVVSVVDGALIFAFASQFDKNVIINLAIWNVAAALYLFTWASISLFVNSFAMSSSANGAALLLLWLILVLLIPRFVSNAVQDAVPTLTENKLVEREKNALDEATRKVGGLVKSFQSEYPEIDIDLDDEQQMALVGYLLAHDAVGKGASAIVTSHYAAQTLRANYLDACNWLSPAISFRNQSDQCSGNSERSFVAFSAHAANVQARVLEAFLVPSIKNEECTVEMIGSFPVFQESDISKEPMILRAVHSIAAMFVWMTIWAGFGIMQFGAKDATERRSRLPMRGDVESA